MNFMESLGQFAFRAAKVLLKIILLMLISMLVCFAGAWELLQQGSSHPGTGLILLLLGFLSTLVMCTAWWLLTLPVRLAGRLIEGPRHNYSNNNYSNDDNSNNQGGGWLDNSADDSGNYGVDSDDN